MTQQAPRRRAVVRLAGLVAVLTAAALAPALPASAAPTPAPTTAPTSAAPAGTTAATSTYVPDETGATCTVGSQVRCVWTALGTLTVPAGVDRVHVDASGGQGGNARLGGDGGRGAQVATDVAVTRGDRISVLVGQQGGKPPSIYGTAPGGSGAGTGGNGGGGTRNAPVTYGGGGGGGASRVRVGASVVAVAGGGGGGGGRGGLFSGGGDGQPPTSTTSIPAGGAGRTSDHNDSGSGGGGGGFEGGRGGAPGEDRLVGSTGSQGGYAGTSFGRAPATIREGLTTGDGRVVVTFDRPDDQPPRSGLLATVTAPTTAAPGTPVEVTVALTNRGDGAAHDVTTRVAFSSNLTVAGEDNRVEWSTALLAPGATESRTYTVTAGRAGLGTIVVAATGLDPDGTAADQGRRTATITVRAPR